MAEYIYASNCEPLANARGEVALARHEIVRCKDCEFGAEGGEYCMRFDELGGYPWFPAEPDGFCAWGVRREKK